MDNKHRQELLEQYEEAAMMLLMDEYAEADGARLLYQFEEAEKNGQVPEIPADLDEKCRKLIQDSFAKQERKNRLLQLGKAAGRVAVYVLVLLGLTTSVVLSVDAIRVPVLNFFMERSDRYSTVSFSEEQLDEKIYNKKITQEIESMLMDGYDLVVEESDDSGTLFLLYQNEKEDIISVNISISSGRLFVDTEDSIQKEVNINNQKAVFIEKDGYRLLWTDDESELTYDIYASGLMLDVFWEVVHKIASCATN